MDADVADAALDLDSGRRPTCTGVPTACATLDVASCESVQGCRVSQCRGVAVQCDDYVQQTQCDATAGCRWSGTACGGRETPCANLDTDVACMAQQGCGWTPAPACRGTALRCEDLTGAACAAQPGCSAYMPGDGGGVGRDAQALWDGGGTCEPPAPASSITGCNPDAGIECDGDWRGINARTGAEYCTPACSDTECCSPQHGNFACVPRDAAGACPAADLFIDRSKIVDDYTIEYRNFREGDCAIVEGCVGGPGIRRLLRFDTWTPNTGTADMFLGQPSRESPNFEYSACHNHYHFNSYAAYELLTPDGSCVTATGHKQAFCLLDFYAYPGTDGRGGTYNCGYQGIQRDWQDVYSRELDCQWVDVTGVPEGDYLLRIRVNTDHILAETNYENNEITVPVTLTADRGPPAVDLTDACPAGTEGVDRNCGWTRSYDGTCEPGAMVSVGCSALCGHGSCTGDTVMRVCETALGVNCGNGLEFAQNDDSGCGTGDCGMGGDCCSRAQFTCPGTGTYTVWTGGFQAAATDATCNVAPEAPPPPVPAP